MHVIVTNILDGSNLSNAMLEMDGVAHAWPDPINIGLVVGSSEKPLRCILAHGDKFYMAQTQLDG